jgi:SAM-dependent methyltransferase
MTSYVQWKKEIMAVKLSIFQKFRPLHSQNRMSHEGDLISARRDFLNSSNKNLKHLLHFRFNWMNEYIVASQKGLELGAGMGASSLILRDMSIELSDLAENDWLDHLNIDALSTGFESSSYDYVIASNMVHHVAKPALFFQEVARIIKPGGLLLMNEANTSLISKLILILMRHEGFDDTADVFDHDYICNDPDDPWSANCSIPRLLFDKPDEFEKNFPDWEIIHDSKHELLIFLNSGGVTAKFFYIPLNNFFLNLIEKIDSVLTTIAPNIFALGRRTVLRKR